MATDSKTVPNLKDSLAMLALGQEIGSAMVAGFSALDTREIDEFFGAVSEIDVSRRQALVKWLVDEAERDIRMDFIELFVGFLDDEDPRVREAAINGLWEHDRIQFIRPLVKLLSHDADYGVRAAAAMSLGRFVFMAECNELDETRSALVSGALREAIESGPDVEVQRRALESIAYLSEDWVMEFIDMAYDHEDERMRQSSLFAMGRTAEERWAPVVLSELDSPLPSMRYEAVKAVGEIGLDEAVERLIALTEDLDGEIVDAAIWSMGQIGGTHVKEVLDFLVENGNEAQAEAAESALDKIEFATRPMQMFSHDYGDVDAEDCEETSDDDDLPSDDRDNDWPDEFLDFD